MWFVVFCGLGSDLRSSNILVCGLPGVICGDLRYSGIPISRTTFGDNPYKRSTIIWIISQAPLPCRFSDSVVTRPLGPILLSTPKSPLLSILRKQYPEASVVEFRAILQPASFINLNMQSWQPASAASHSIWHWLLSFYLPWSLTFCKYTITIHCQHRTTTRCNYVRYLSLCDGF